MNVKYIQLAKSNYKTAVRAQGAAVPMLLSSVFLLNVQKDVGF